MWKKLSTPTVESGVESLTRIKGGKMIWKRTKLLDGLINMDIAPNWSLHDDCQVITLGSPDNDAGVNVSHWTRRDESVTLDARQNLESFLKARSAHGIECIVDSRDFARSRFLDGADTPWEAIFYAHPPDLVLVTSTVSPNATQNSKNDIERMLSSIEFKARKRLFKFWK
jgi:hypothetical protein